MRISNLNFNVQVQGYAIPFVWGHGLTASMQAEDERGMLDWASVAEVARLVRYDARGHGLSEPTFDPADYDWSNLALDMLAIAEAVGFDRFIAGGQSMGCATALYAALAAPERVKALVLANPPTAWETRAAQAKLYDHMAELLEDRGVEMLIKVLAQRPVAPAWQREVAAHFNALYFDTLRRFDPRVLATVLRGATRCNLPPREDLRRLTMPALILAWTDDPGHPMETADALAGLLPNSRLVVAQSLPEARAYAGHIRDFLAHLSPPSVS